MTILRFSSFQLWLPGDNNKHLHVFIHSLQTHGNVSVYTLLLTHLPLRSGYCVSYCSMLSDRIGLLNTCCNLGTIRCSMLVTKSETSLYTGKYIFSVRHFENFFLYCEAVQPFVENKYTLYLHYKWQGCKSVLLS